MVAEFGIPLGACLGGFGIAKVKPTGVPALANKAPRSNFFQTGGAKDFPLYALYPSGHLPAA